LRRVASQTKIKSLTFLDVAGGTGDVADRACQDLARDEVQISSAVLDRSISHMNGFGELSKRIAGDALALPFASGSFDVVGCNLFCHHLQPDEMVAFFDEGLRVARLALIASELRRNLVHWIAAQAGKLTYRSRLTRNDAPASVRQAYTTDEMRALAERTAAASYDLRPYYFQRFGLILWKNQQ